MSEQPKLMPSGHSTRWLKIKLGCAAFAALTILPAAILLGHIFHPFNHFPAATLNAVKNDSNLIFYSLDPELADDPLPGIPLLHGHRILGQTVLRAESDRKRVIESLRQAARFARDGAACFDPRHGLSATGSSGTQDILLCFACRQAIIYFPDGHRENIPIRGLPTAFNEILSAAHVDLSKR